ncbi:hypothetical protein BN7_3365 [Wickerhamomyces ciferrii]|uniref:Velvet domain-containing protein n=1 Tax=Wickerhamomyces ciferrii (strain ATCC 14091 / BCRC 22168 / CBS 111 / JCM 3599 / NBRC 0793 / NRRL Y-1031 F-60-10) TaxID=1206466 RepID=K0KLG2_WICCF|nr:uncharacterized protein BN7_3365 [Wickerhamomyces ciferrii]CCH43811.1 hypothetical protein BN7_3365 [Wickerhamomyces ciferrii]
MTVSTGRYRFELDIAQQPIRARMCGLGDKDRRQISPPPFVKLLVFDKDSNQPVNIDDVDISSFVIVVELWSPDEKEDLSLNQNIITEDSNPSSPVDQDKPPMIQNDAKPSELTTTTAVNNDTTATTTTSTTPISATAMDDHSRSYPKPNPQPVQSQQRSSSGSESEGSIGDIPTRNLIGNLVTNAFKLFDEHNNRGIWFILHDLSVRIEGEFKLKLSFVDLNTDEMIYKFSDSFKVYSAKKFPGVVDSSHLGRVFASQGVKIPIRRDTKDHN